MKKVKLDIKNYVETYKQERETDYFCTKNETKHP